MRSYNIIFPLTDDTEKSNFLSTSKITKEAFSSNLVLLLLTRKGERYYNPEYGTDLLRFIFEPNDALTHSEVEDDIKRIVSLYIPNLTIDGIEFNVAEDNETHLNVKVKFTYNEDAFSEEGELDLNF